MEVNFKSDQKSASNRSDDGKCKFCGRIHKPAYGQNVANARKKIIRQTAVTRKRLMKHQLHHQIILCTWGKLQQVKRKSNCNSENQQEGEGQT